MTTVMYAGCSDETPEQATNASMAGMAAAGSGGAAQSAGGGAAAAGGGGAGTVAGAGAAAVKAGAGGGAAGQAGSAGGSGTGSGTGGGGEAGAVAGAGGSNAPDTGCARELLKQTVDAYLMALAAHDPAPLPLAANAKFTENGEMMELGEGLWAKAGMAKSSLSLYDTKVCGSVTQAVVPDGTTDIPLGLRLQLVDRKITEIETIAVRSGDYIVASNTRAMITAAEDDWEAIVPADKRATRAELESWMEKYFKLFPEGGCALSDDCRRMENGFSLDCTAAVTCSDEEPGERGVMNPRLVLVDEEASLAAGFVMFIGGYTDFHMIKHVGGEVLGVYAVLGSADQSGWD